MSKTATKTEIGKIFRAFCRWLSTHPSDIGTRVRLSLDELKSNGPSPSFLATLAEDVEQLRALTGRVD